MILIPERDNSKKKDNEFNFPPTTCQHVASLDLQMPTLLRWQRKETSLSFGRTSFLDGKSCHKSNAANKYKKSIMMEHVHPSCATCVRKCQSLYCAFLVDFFLS